MFTEWGEKILTFRGIMEESGNPIFCHGAFPTQMIPWPAIEGLDRVPVTEANMKLNILNY